MDLTTQYLGMTLRITARALGVTALRGYRDDQADGRRRRRRRSCCIPCSKSNWPWTSWNCITI